jgi:hypothetical protein
MSKGAASFAVGLGRDGRVAATPFWEKILATYLRWLESTVGVVAVAKEHDHLGKTDLVIRFQTARAKKKGLVRCLEDPSAHDQEAAKWRKSSGES